MKRLISLMLAFIYFAQMVSAQTTDYAASGRLIAPTEVAEIIRIYQSQSRDAQFDRLRLVSQRNQDTSRVYVSQSSNDLTVKARKYIAPSSLFQREFKSLLKNPNAGIIKLFPEKACVADENDKTPNLSKVIKRCPLSFIPGGAEYFSFRNKDYVESVFADIGFKNNYIFSLGLFNQGILVNLGDVPIESLKLTDKGISFLNDFAAEIDLKEADKQYKQFEEGVKVDDLLYQKVLPVKTNKTYGLRVIAYESDYSYSFKINNRTGIVFPFHGFDRKDVIIVFRIVEVESDGTLTIVWKEIQSKAAPKMIVPESNKSEKSTH